MKAIIGRISNRLNYNYKQLLFYKASRKMLQPYFEHLALKNIKKIRICHLKHWKHWTTKDNYTFFRIFFYGKLNGRKVFIKIGNDDTTNNEYYAFDVINKIDNKHIVKSLFKSIDKDVVVIAYPFKRFRRINNQISKQSFDEICNNLLALFEDFGNYGIVHCDLSLANMLLCKNELMVIDFGCAYLINKPIGWQPIDYLFHVCTDKIYDGNHIVFDDYHSAVNTFIRLNLPNSYYDLVSYKKMLSMVGKNKCAVY